MRKIRWRSRSFWTAVAVRSGDTAFEARFYKEYRRKEIRRNEPRMDTNGKQLPSDGWRSPIRVHSWFLLALAFWIAAPLLKPPECESGVTASLCDRSPRRLRSFWSPGQSGARTPFKYNFTKSW